MPYASAPISAKPSNTAMPARARAQAIEDCEASIAMGNGATEISG